MTGIENTDWRELCKLASQERDSGKLLQLVDRLNDVLARQATQETPGLSAEIETPSED